MTSPLVLLPVLQAFSKKKNRSRSLVEDEEEERETGHAPEDDALERAGHGERQGETQSFDRARELESGSVELARTPDHHPITRRPKVLESGRQDHTDSEDELENHSDHYRVPTSSETERQLRQASTDDYGEDVVYEKRRRLGIIPRRRPHGRNAAELEGQPNILKRIRKFIWANDPDGDIKSFIPNYRYLPILSGVISPFAILLEIPGLTEPWYVRTEGNHVAEYRSNPTLLEIGMAVSMAAAVVGNVALIIRFLEKRVKLATIIAIMCLVFHDIINIVTVTIFGVVHRFDDGFTYAEAFWMVVCSTLASVVATVTLFWDLHFTEDFARSGSGLTQKQRSLIVIVMVLISYIALGSLVYSIVMNLTFQDGLYFTVVSLETIGFGDIAPSNTGSRVFAIFYNTIGIINVGLAITTTRETIVEAFENSYRRRTAEVARRRHENKVLRQNQRARRILIEKELKELGLPLYVKETQPRDIRHGLAAMNAGLKLNEGALKERHLVAVDEQEKQMHRTVLLGEEDAEDELSAAKRKGKEEPQNISSVPEDAINTQHPDDAEVETHELDAESKRGRALEIAKELERELQMSNAQDGTGQDEAYVNFKNRIAKEELKEFRTKLLVSWTLFLTFWLIGAAIFMKTEKWTFTTGLYFCWVSFSTIGYGDVTPKSPAGRAIFVVWALMGVAAMTVLISVLSEAYSNRYKSALHSGSFEKALKSYKDRTRENADLNTATSTPMAESPPAHPQRFNSQASTTLVTPEKETSWPPSAPTMETYKEAKDQLDSIPLEVILSAKEFHDHVKFFTNLSGGSGGLTGQQEPPPEGIRQLLNEIAAAEKMDDRMKKEMLEDDESRRVLFTMSYERAFKKLIDTAQNAVRLISIRETEREQLLSRLQGPSAGASTGLEQIERSELVQRLARLRSRSPSDDPSRTPRIGSGRPSMDHRVTSNERKGDTSKNS